MAGLATLKSTGSKRTASVASTGKSKTGSAVKLRYPRFAICIDNRGHEPSLQMGKVYAIIKPHKLDRPHDVRVIDEEGEDYLYPSRRFVALEVPVAARKAVIQGLSACNP